MFKIAWNKILNAKHTVVVSHMHPDGDTIGSSLALYTLLHSFGKRVSLFNATAQELPKAFDFLDGFHKFSNTLPKFFDCLISCDCGSFDRLGVPRGDYTLINIDHHISNDNFGDENIVLRDHSSTGMVVYEFLKDNQVSINKPAACALYAAIGDDTGFFRYGSIGAKTFEVASELIHLGANPQEIAAQILSRKSLAKTRLDAYVLSNFELHHDAQIASIFISKETLAKTGAKRSDAKNIISSLRDIVNVKIALMLLEQDDHWKISLRSQSDVDLSYLSFEYGGGGHKNAVGFSLPLADPKSALNKIIKSLKKENNSDEKK